MHLLTVNYTYKENYHKIGRQMYDHQNDDNTVLANPIRKFEIIWHTLLMHNK